MVSASLFSILLLIISCHCIFAELNYEEHNQTMRIDLSKQKLPALQQSMSPLRNYGIKLHHLYRKKRGNNTRTNDTITLYSYLNNELYGKINIGKPGQTFNIAFDTTWSRSWVISSRCSLVDYKGCSGHNRYDHDKSSQYKPNGTKFSYVDGYVNMTGFYSYEAISVAHSNVTDFLFIEMTGVPDNFIFNKVDGVIGFGLKEDSYDPFFYKLLQQKKIKDPIFSVYINRNHQSGKIGSVQLGFVDKSHIKVVGKDGNNKIYDKITYLPINSKPYWRFEMSKLILIKNPKTNYTFCANGCNVTVDISSYAIIGPTKEISRINDLLGAEKISPDILPNRYSVNCDHIQQLPHFDFVFGDTTFSFMGKKYITKVQHNGFVICVTPFVEAEQSVEETLWILGTTFLSEVYSIYDVSKPQIGLVSAA